MLLWGRLQVRIFKIETRSVASGCFKLFKTAMFCNPPFLVEIYDVIAVRKALGYFRNKLSAEVLRKCRFLDNALRKSTYLTRKQ